ncbi:hypothetical protein IV203_016896 [Nitzschia inconspicua]|uniref:Uncharacterized protein n=1 Tax=Nitzschia inconspicua TaxID=303405 RepID=A0A9K3PIP8_9STRA|nr:hypothetical protein IV203_016896 [Nitzschia inconspicua]
MMKVCTLIVATLVSTTLGAPAVVWKNGRSEQRFLHSSEHITASDLMATALPESEAPDASSLSVVFLVGKGEDGSEQLSELASSGKLPKTSQKYSDAAGIYHHVSGIESSSTVVRDAVRASTNDRVLEVSLKELNQKLNSLDDAATLEMEIDNQGNTIKPASKSSSKRARDLANANVCIVNVSSKGDVSDIDAAISSAIENKNVDSVILAGVRSIHEVKHERYLLSKRRMAIMEQEGNKVLDSRRRRLEQAAEGEGGNIDASDYLSGVYYVSMTPNILSGLLFFLLFIVIAYTGISCMGAIQGQDVFTDKMPSIGREA